MDNLKPIVAGCKAMIIKAEEHPEHLYQFVDVIRKPNIGILCEDGSYTTSSDWIIVFQDQSDRDEWFCEENYMIRIDVDGDDKEEFEEDFELSLLEPLLKAASTL